MNERRIIVISETQAIHVGMPFDGWLMEPQPENPRVWRFVKRLECVPSRAGMIDGKAVAIEIWP